MLSISLRVVDLERDHAALLSKTAHVRLLRMDSSAPREGALIYWFEPVAIEYKLFDPPDLAIRTLHEMLDCT